MTWMRDGESAAHKHPKTRAISAQKAQKARKIAYVEIMHWSYNEPGQWRCAVSVATYQAHRLGERGWMAEKIDPTGHCTALGLYDTLKDCKVYAGLDYVSEVSHKYPRSNPV